jgi:hypothetical protein
VKTAGPKLSKAIRFLLIGLAVLVAIGLILFSLSASRLIAGSAPAEIKYTDVVVIVLTALSLMITILGIGLAVMGVIGWATFESKLRDSSLTYFAEQLGKDGPLRRELESLLIEISLKGIDKAPPQTDEGKQEGEYVD